jgi:hypothetical protein
MSADLERRVRILEDIEAIKRLKYRYWRHLDLKQWDQLAELFARDATVSYGDGKHQFSGVDSIIDFLRRSLGWESGSITLHHGHHPEIELVGDDGAEGTWALYNYMFNERQNRCIRIGAYYHDRYARIGGQWRFRHIGYTHLFHEEWDRGEVRLLEKLKPEG